ncbi:MULTISPECIES: hypothetical protein [unclassified Micromonospora]|uniref:hypothetical protein n=1 Tax=unclassified Micromonospora TaxID=2617518 RepID=UPI003326623B
MTAPTEPTTAPAVPAQPAQTTPPAQPPAAPPVPSPSQVFPPQQPAAQLATPAQPALGNGEHGYPENTPLAQMNADQREAYWRHQARKHENTVKARADYDDLKAKAAEFDKLQAANQTEMQRAVAEAEQRARTDALTQAGAKIAETALRTSLKLAKGMDDAEIDRIVGPLNCNYFLSGDGLSVDTDKVTTYLNTVAAPAPAAPAPAPAAAAAIPPAAAQPATGAVRQVPDMGQGNRTATPSGGLAAGAERAKAYLAKQQGSKPVITR